MVLWDWREAMDCNSPRRQASWIWVCCIERLQAKQVDVVAGSNTDGMIAALGLTVLEDDRHYFPPYDAVPIVRPEALQQNDGMRTALEQLSRTHFNPRHASHELRGGWRKA